MNRAPASVYDFATPDATGRTDCSAELKNAHDQAWQRGCRTLYFPTGRYFAPNLTGCGNVVFVGDGQLTGAYRKAIFPGHLGPRELVRGNVVPSRHLAVFLRAVAAADDRHPAVVAIVGDSTGIRANAPAESEQQGELLKRRLAEAFPGRPIAVRNFAVGGQSWAALDGVARSNWPAFYADHAAPWLGYVERAQPDLLVFNFGMIDQARLDIHALRSVVGKVGRWAKPCSLLFGINYVPTLMEEGFGSEVAQEGRELAAGYQRSFCRRYAYGFLDFGRQLTLLRDGFDIEQQAMQFVSRRQAVATPWSFPGKVRDFAFRCAFPGAFDTMWSNGRLVLQLSGRADNILAIERDAASGCVAVSVEAAASAGSVARTVTPVAVAAGDLRLSVHAKGGHLGVQVNDAEILNGPVERFGGLFVPVLAWQDGARTPFVLLDALAGAPMACMPQYLDIELFGTTDYSHAEGGNGRNHLTSTGMQAVMGRVIDVTQWSD